MAVIAQIAQACEDEFGALLRDISANLSDLSIKGQHRRFLVTRMGSTGSTWLSKLLNADPEVFCYHEGVVAKVFPDRSYGNGEILAFIWQLAEDLMHGAYAAAGDVGSTWMFHVASLPKGSFTTGMLIRHPARLLHTRLNVFPSDKSFTSVDFRCMRCIEKVWGIGTRGLSEIDQVFLQDAFVFALQALYRDRVDLVIPIERMRDPDFCRHALYELTGISYGAAVVSALRDRPVNRRVNITLSVRDILETFTGAQRQWYWLILEEVLPLLGYAPDHDMPQAFQQV